MSAWRFPGIFCVGVVSSICCLVVGAGLIWASALLFLCRHMGIFLSARGRVAVCSGRLWCVGAGVGARLLGLILCRPSDGGWGALCQRGGLWGLLYGRGFVLVGLHCLVCTEIFVCLHGVFLCRLGSGVFFWLQGLLLVENMF